MESNKIHTKQKWILGAVIAVIILAGLGYWWHTIYRQGPVTPQMSTEARLQKLKQLEAESAPVTATTAQRNANLLKLQKSSKPVKATIADRLKKLEALSH